MRKKGVTIAICTHNGRERLEKTLSYILAQEVPLRINWELLIIDNASTDETDEFIREFIQKHSDLDTRIILEETLGAIHARLRAVKEANFTYLSYVDDDNWISANWVKEVYQIFETQPTVGLISCPSKAHLSETPPDYFEGFKGWLAVGKRCDYEGIIKERPMSFWTAGLSLKLEAFDVLTSLPYSLCLTGRTGNETYGGEDHEICLTLTLMGWQVYYTYDIYFIHSLPSHRLSISYLEHLIQNGGKSRAILDIYRNEYWQRKFYHPYSSILEYFGYWLNRAIRYWLKFLLGKARTPLHPNRVSYLHAIGRMQGYFLHFRKIPRAQENIKVLRAMRKNNQFSNIMFIK